VVVLQLIELKVQVWGMKKQNQQKKAYNQTGVQHQSNKHKTNT